MAAGTNILLKRKAGAFSGGELAAGEMGIDTTNGVVYFSTNGSTVSVVSSNYIGALQSDIAEMAFDLAILQNEGRYEMANGIAITYDDSTGIEEGSSSNYAVDTVSERVGNRTTAINIYTGSLANVTGFSGRTVICLVPAASISSNGAQIRIQLEGGPNGLDLSDLFVSQQATSGDAFDSHTDITRVQFDGVNSVSLGANATKLSDWTTYALDSSKNLLVCANITATNMAYVSLSGFVSYYKNASTDAGTQNRSGYTNWGTFRTMVKAVESRTAAQSMSVVSTAYAAPAVPASAACTMRFVKPDNNVALNTDLIVEISRDGGTTWSTVTLTELRTAGTTVVASGTIAVSGQPSGSSLRSRITTPGGTPKAVEIIAHTLQVR
jgi:hypothetical protein